MNDPTPIAHIPLWSKRLARTIELQSLIPHSKEILDFYRNLLPIQNQIAHTFSESSYSSNLFSEDRQSPCLQISHFDVEYLTRSFDYFLETIQEIGTDIMIKSVTTLLNKPRSSRTKLLGTALETNFSENVDLSLFLRGFFEPIYVTLAQASDCQRNERLTNKCFFCGSKPALSLIRDLPGYQGARHLVCSMCATEWRFPRLTCSNCNENDSKNLELHISDDLDHLRIEACKSCGCYIKNLDLRQSAKSVPIVDEIASLELDLWANRQGLTKPWPNLLQL